MKSIIFISKIGIRPRRGFRRFGETYRFRKPHEKLIVSCEIEARIWGVHNWDGMVSVICPYCKRWFRIARTTQGGVDVAIEYEIYRFNTRAVSHRTHFVITGDVNKRFVEKLLGCKIEEWELFVSEYPFPTDPDLEVRQLNY